MPAPYTDWNVYLQEQANPTAQEIPMPPDPMETFRMPTDPSIRPEQIGKAIDFMYGLQKHRIEARNAAKRYKGQQDFQRIRSQLLSAQEPEESATYKAFSQTAADLFPDNPLHAAQALHALKPTVPPGKPGTVMPFKDPTSDQVIGHAVVGPDGKQHFFMAPHPSAAKADAAQADDIKKLDANISDARKELVGILHEVNKGTADTKAMIKARQLREQISALEGQRHNVALTIGGGSALPMAPPTRATQPAPGLTVNPASTAPPSSARPPAAPPGKIVLQRKKDGQFVTYPAARRAEVPLDQFDILP